jgi:hypothetical protein
VLEASHVGRVVVNVSVTLRQRRCVAHPTPVYAQYFMDRCVARRRPASRGWTIWWAHWKWGGEPTSCS